jgi:2-oxoglutarate ferredoxin oxidoreductase subunit gamma
MHHQFWPPTAAKLRPEAVVVVNAPLFATALDRDALRVFDVPATAIATELGQPLAASMVLIGAFARATGVVALESLVAAMAESIPPYRRQHVETNERALRAGFDATPSCVAPAWEAAA